MKLELLMEPAASIARISGRRLQTPPVWPRAVLLLGALLPAAFAGCGTDRDGLGGNQPPNTDPAPRPDARAPNPDPDPDPLPPDAGPTDGPPVDSRPNDVMSLPADARADRPSNPNCAFGFHQARRATPEVLLLVDRSPGMRKTVMGTTQTRWFEMTAGVDDAVRKTAAGLQWGLKLFPTTTMCEVADGVDVQVGASNYNAVIMKMRGTEPATGPDGSPLHTAIRKAANALVQRATANPKYLVLATDANVSCLPGLPAEMEAVKNVQTAAGQGIKTFVLGTAAIGSHQHTLLDQLAVAGGEPIAGPTKYHAVQNKAEVLAALDRISEQLTSCVWTVPAQAPAPNFVAMEIDGVRVPRDVNQREGWNWAMGANRQVLHVYGAACERLRTSPSAVVEMIYGCEGIAP
jgi:hypothetical protein